MLKLRKYVFINISYIDSLIFSLLGSVVIPLKGLIKQKAGKQEKDLTLLDGSKRPTKVGEMTTFDFSRANMMFSTV